MMSVEFLVTAQGYLKTDNTKQIILLHDVFKANTEQEATDMFKRAFETDYKVLNVYSAVNIEPHANKLYGQ